MAFLLLFILHMIIILIGLTVAGVVAWHFVAPEIPKLWGRYCETICVKDGGQAKNYFMCAPSDFPELIKPAFERGGCSCCEVKAPLAGKVKCEGSLCP